MSAEKNRLPLTFVVADWEPGPELGMTMADKAILRCLVDRLNRKRNGTEVWPSNAALARKALAHPDTVKKSKANLHAMGLIKIRRDSGKSDMVTINEDLIRALADPREKAGGSETHPPEKAGGYPPEKPGGTPPKNHPRTAKEQLIGNSNISPVSCSTKLKVQDGPHQRKLAVHGVVARAADTLRSPGQEQLTEKKPNAAREEALQLADGLRRAREGPG